MVRKLVAGFLVVLIWSGTALARPPRICACSGDPVRPGGQARDAHVFVKNILDAQLSAQNVRNAQLQADLLRSQVELTQAQIRAAQAVYRKEMTLMWVAIGGVLTTGAVWAINHWRENCELVKADGGQIWTCAW